MVLEHLFPEEWLEKKFRYAFLLGFVYSVIGIILAEFLFPSNSGIVSVIFTSVFLSPSMRKIFSIEEKSEEKNAKFSLKKLYRLHYDVFLMYLVIFMAIFFSYLLFSFVLPQFNISTFDLLKEQLFVEPYLRGKAGFEFGTFQSIFLNNWWVLLAAFILALIAGDGAIFFITWNASAWGAIFGFRALSSAYYTQEAPLYVLTVLLLVVIWHVIIEGSAYILAGISGSIISSRIIKEKIEVKDFVIWLLTGSLLFLFLKYIVNFMDAGSWTAFILYFLLTMAMLYFLHKILEEKKNKQVFTYASVVFVISVGIFILGAVVETFVLSSSGALARIYGTALCYAANIPLGECLSI